MEHSKTPWRIEPATKKDNWRIIAANNQVVSTFSGNMDMDNARRIVAAVNYCEGLDVKCMEIDTATGRIPRAVIPSLTEQIEKLTSQRDELLAVLERIAANKPAMMHDSEQREVSRGKQVAETIGKARAVIKKVRGGEC